MQVVLVQKISFREFCAQVAQAFWSQMTSSCGRRQGIAMHRHHSAPPGVAGHQRLNITTEQAADSASKHETESWNETMLTLVAAGNSTALTQNSTIATTEVIAVESCPTDLEFKLELCWLRNRAAHWGLPLITSTLENDFVCGECQQPCVAMVTNPHCGHSACASCWTRCAEALVDQRSNGDKLHEIVCLDPDCSQCLPWVMVRGICAGYSPMIAMHVCRIDPQFKRDQMRIMNGKTPRAVQATYFDVCTVCRDICPVLLANGACDHAVCEHCWKRWAESQIPRSLANRQDTVRCFSPQCQQAMCAPLWSHVTTISKPVQDFDELPGVVRRRQLKNNTLYPEALQADCPEPACWGLGYLGFDTVMCFMCEHQWVPEAPGSSPNDVDVQEVMGVKAKQCPNCHEHIEKNGGCDHMTCRCKYEFFWTTLKPFRS